VPRAQLAPVLFARATAYRLSGRVRFDKECIGDVVVGPDDEFVVFRKMVLASPKGHSDPPRALFTVRFHFARFPATANKRLSLIPAAFIAAQPGFVSKTWLLGRNTGMFCGVYEWRSSGDAESYWTSFPMRLMKRRAVPESLGYEITAIH